MQTEQINNGAARDAGYDSFGTKRAVRNNALDECGIGHDVEDRLRPQLERIATFCAGLQQRATQQAIYNELTNTPAGIEFGDPLTTALAGACGALVQWDITAALAVAVFCIL